MKPAKFHYIRPLTLTDALKHLQGTDAQIIAGGQSLVPMMNFRMAQPETLVDITKIAELKGIHEEDDVIRFGALVTHTEVLQSKLIESQFPVIGEAIAQVAHIAIRNRGTIGGSVAHADPSAEWPLLVTLLDARIEILRSDGERAIVSPKSFFIGPLVTDLGEGDILTAIHLPKIKGAVGMAFEEVAQRAGDFAVVSVGAIIRMDKEAITQVRIAIGGANDTAYRSVEAEAFLLGKTPSSVLLEEAAKKAIDGLRPDDDIHASAAYRLHLIPKIVQRVLHKALLRVATKDQRYAS